MRQGQSTTLKAGTASEMRIRIITGIALRIGTVAGFAAAIMLIMSDVKVWDQTFLAYEWELSTETARPGDWVVASLRIPEAKEIGEFSISLDLPQGEGLSFISGSMEVYAGNISGARIPGYSGESSMGIYEIPAQEGPLHFEVSIQVPADLALLGKSVEIRPRFSVIGENFKSKPAYLTIDAAELTIQNTPVAAPNGQIGYEIVVSNPQGGIRFDELGKAFNLDVDISHPDARLIADQVKVITDQVLPDVEEQANHLSIQGISLGTGGSMSVFVPVELPQHLSASQVKASAKAVVESVNLASSEVVAGKESDITYDQVRLENRTSRAFLSWAVMEEVNNKGFFIEHSLDGENFQTMALVPGSEDHQDRLTYQYESEPLHRGRHIFRLRQEDRNGRSMYTNQQEMFVGFERPATLDLSNFSPANGGYLSVAVQKQQQVRLEISTASGNPVKTLFHGTMKPMTPYDIYLNQQEFSPGNYQLVFQGVLEEMTLPIEIAG